MNFVISKKSYVFMIFALIFIFSFSLKKIAPIDNFYRSQVRVAFAQIKPKALHGDFRESRFAKEIADEIINPKNLESFFENNKVLISYQIYSKNIFSFVLRSDNIVTKELIYKYIFNIKSMYESKLIRNYIDNISIMIEEQERNCFSGYNINLGNKTSYFYKNIINNSMDKSEMESCFESNGYKVSWLKNFLLPSTLETNQNLIAFSIIDKFTNFPKNVPSPYSTINNFLFSLFVSVLSLCFLILYNFRSRSKP